MASPLESFMPTTLGCWGQLPHGFCGKRIGGYPRHRIKENREGGLIGDFGEEGGYEIGAVAGQSGGSQHQHGVGAALVRLGNLPLGGPVGLGIYSAEEKDLVPDTVAGCGQQLEAFSRFQERAFAGGTTQHEALVSHCSQQRQVVAMSVGIKLLMVVERG